MLRFRPSLIFVTCAIFAVSHTSGSVEVAADWIEESVTIPGPDDTISLAGTLLLPPNASQESTVAAIVLITGSGPQDRDETIAGQKPFKLLAEGLVKHGYAVLRYDDRGTKALGIGESTGSFTGSTPRDFADDASSVFDFVSQDPRIDANRLIACGHSTGGLVTAMLLGSDERLAAAVLLASPAVRGDELLSHQLEVLAKISNEEAGSPVIEETLAEQSALQTDLILAAAGDDERALREAAWAAIAPAYQKAGIDPDSLDKSVMDAAIEQAKAPLTEPWMAAFLRYTPQPDLRATRSPILAIYGGLDLQVEWNQNAPPMSLALIEGGNPKSVVLTIPRGNHLFQSAETGLPQEYSNLTDTMPPLLIDMIAAWLDTAVE